MTTQTLAQITMAIWLLCITASFAYVAWRPFSVRLGPAQLRRAALYGVAGAIGEAVTLYAAGLWS